MAGTSCVQLLLAPASEFSRTLNLQAGYAIGTVAGFAVLLLSAWGYRRMLRRASA